MLRRIKRRLRLVLTEASVKLGLFRRLEPISERFVEWDGPGDTFRPSSDRTARVMSASASPNRPAHQRK